MQCTYPRPAAELPLTRTRNGKRKLKFLGVQPENWTGLVLPCGQCTGCRLRRARNWAVRCLHEASLHQENCFITLTYSDEYLPKHATLVKLHFQKFIRALRKATYGRKMRYYMCGEYGDKNGRPHYHILLFGFRPFDVYKSSKTRKGFLVHQSRLLEKAWTKGYSNFGDLTFQSAGYVARYVLKKQYGKTAPAHYKERIPEFTLMSRKPGIARAWWETNKNDVQSIDAVWIKQGGKSYSIKPPPYYDRLFEIDDPIGFSIMKSHRRKNHRLVEAFDRRKVIDQVAKLKVQHQMKRDYENE